MSKNRSAAETAPGTPVEEPTTETPTMTAEERKDAARAAVAQIEARPAQRTELETQMANFDRVTSDAIQSLATLAGVGANDKTFEIQRKGRPALVFRSKKDKANPNGPRLWVVATPRQRKGVITL